jgi:hypothetical protein
VSGIDGSGKTTVVESLAQALRENGRDVRTVWLRYNHYLTKIVLGLGRLSGLTEYQYFPGCRVGYHHFHRSWFFSHLFILTTWVDTALTTLICVILPRLLPHRITICDRWVPDILIDLEIDTHIDVSRHPLYGRLFWGLVASDIPLLILQRDIEDVRAARLENQYDKNFEKRFRLYESMASLDRCRRVDNSGSLHETVINVRGAIQ